MLTDRERLDEAEETIRQLRQLIVPPVVLRWTRGFTPTPSEWIVLNCLARASDPCSAEFLRGRLDIAFDSGATSKSANVLICKLRRKLKCLTPPIEIFTNWGVGYWMDEENKALLAIRHAP